jgi:hypothetical protein
MGACRVASPSCRDFPSCVPFSMCPVHDICGVCRFRSLCPSYRWATTNEVLEEARFCTDKGAAYWDIGGWNRFTWEGAVRWGFVCMDSHRTLRTHHALDSFQTWPLARDLWTARRFFAGVICISTTPRSAPSPIKYQLQLTARPNTTIQRVSDELPSETSSSATSPRGAKSPSSPVRAAAAAASSPSAGTTDFHSAITLLFAPHSSAYPVT